MTETKEPLHPKNPHYAVLDVTSDTGFAGIQNSGFDGIVVKDGEHFHYSVFARQLTKSEGRLEVGLERKNGELLGSAKLPPLTSAWKKYSATITATDPADDARLVLLTRHPGRIALDMISLFPQDTFKNRPNGLRADLARTIADLKPKFMRFPGGCLVHGDGLYNIYQWKDTIGPVEQRKDRRNIWNYHQSVGLGYFEYFQFCEDIGAKPLPVVAAGVCCQNANARFTHKYGVGQEGVPMDQMPACVQDVLDLIEYANGPADSEWGARRAAAGHPAPFGLQFLGVGNEDKITPVFEERFKMIFEAVKRKHPDITVVGTVGPAPDGEDYDKGWEIANQLAVPMVDEHYYKPPQWFWDNLGRYDRYDRSRSKVYVGEYAAHDDKRRSTLRSAIAEAAHLTALERNGDVVRFASSAPLLADRRHVNWAPDLIYFNRTGVFPTINYHVQQLFSVNSGDHYLPTSMSHADEHTRFSASAVRDSRSGAVILKLVNGENEAKPLRVEISGGTGLSPEASLTVLAGKDVNVENQDGREPAVTNSSISIGRVFDYEAPANSLTVIRIKRRAGN